MKKAFLFFTFSFLTLSLWAAPVVSGGEGLARIIDARNQGLSNWTAGVSFAGMDHGAEHMLDWDIRTWQNSVLRVFGSWVPLDALEVNAALGFGYSYPYLTSSFTPYVGFWDVELGAKYTWPLEFWFVGVDARAFLPPRSPFFGQPVFGGALRVLATREMDIFSTHLNLGIQVRERTGALLGAGGELHYGIFNPYIELTAEAFPDSFPLRLTPGLRINTNFGLSVYYAADFGLTADARSRDLTGRQYVNQASAGLSYSPAQTVTRRAASFFVTVTDAISGEPLAAQIIVEKHYPGVFVLGSNGQRLIEVQSGTYRVTVSAPGYLPQTHMMHFSSWRTANLRVALEPDRTSGYLVVRVLDCQNTRPVEQASVTVNGLTVLTDDKGEARFSVPIGSYSMTVSAEGYVSKTEQVTLSSGIAGAVNISICPVLGSGTRITLTGIHFASGSAVLEPSSYPVIDEAVARLKGNPGLRIEVQGHTDSQGSADGNLALSQRRAEAVRDYIVVAHGLAPDRVVARGYGESMPVASNDTEEERAQNRRVELLLLP